MRGEGPNNYQLKFFKASMGYFPNTDSEKYFARVSLPVSAEDTAWRHMVNSAIYASEVVSALLDGKKDEAVIRLRDFRGEGMETRGFGKEALTKLQGVGLIDELYGDSELNDLSDQMLREAQVKLNELSSLQRPIFED